MIWWPLRPRGDTGAAGRSARAGLWGLLVAVALGFMAWSAVASYASVWLASELRLPARQLALAFAVTGAAGVTGSLAGGHLVRRWSARPAMMVCSLAQAVLSLWLFSQHEATGLAITGLALVTFLQPVRGVAQRGVLAAVVAPTARERAFVGFRTAMNLGVVAGPAVLALLLLAGWAWARIGVVVLFAVASLSALLVPQRPPDGIAIPRSALAVLRSVAGDSRLLCLFAVATGAWTLVSGVEVVLPAVLTGRHEIPAPAWGFAYAAASVTVVVLQTPVGDRMARFTLGPRLCLGTAALGAAFAPELVTVGLTAVTCTLALFAAGELTWGPPSEEIVVALAPANSELGYIAAAGASIWVGESIAAAAGFLTGQYISPAASWTAFLVIGAITVAGYWRLSNAASKLWRYLRNFNRGALGSNLSISGHVADLSHREGSWRRDVNDTCVLQGNRYPGSRRVGAGGVRATPA